MGEELVSSFFYLPIQRCENSQQARQSCHFKNTASQSPRAAPPTIELKHALFSTYKVNSGFYPSHHLQFSINNHTWREVVSTSHQVSPSSSSPCRSGIWIFRLIKIICERRIFYEDHHPQAGWRDHGEWGSHQASRSLHRWTGAEAVLRVVSVNVDGQNSFPLCFNQASSH